MKAIIDAMEFKRLVDNTKKFVSKNESNKLMTYIYLQVNAETKEVKATAVDGHRISVEYAIGDVWTDESFNCYIKPVIPKIAKNDRFIELELVDKKAYITVNDNIMGYKQPECVYFKTDKMIQDLEAKEPTASIWVDPRLLKEALDSAIYGYHQPVKIEIRDKKDPILIKRKSGYKDIKLVLPVNVPESEV